MNLDCCLEYIMHKIPRTCSSVEYEPYFGETKKALAYLSGVLALCGWEGLCTLSSEVVQARQMVRGRMDVDVGSSAAQPILIVSTKSHSLFWDRLAKLEL
uniref:Uncharacterized protein n=1 Tax=Opuntia streptacantha TaxID=393608 RepID=A0A7C8YND4_OPUST